MNKHTRQLRKIGNYTRHVLKACIPDQVFRAGWEARLANLSPVSRSKVQKRVDYYIKHAVPFELGPNAIRIGDLRPTGSYAYFFDLRNLARHFPRHCRVDYLFGDITHVPETPALVKSRPIGEDNHNSVLTRFNQVRHFYFVKNDKPYHRKQSKLVWRGKGFRKPARLEFIERFLDHPLCDVGNTDKRSRDEVGHKPFMSIAEQLDYKFVMSIEGNDVATNLKWILSANSLCFMPRPRHETWFMEGTLKPGVHYVEVRDDYEDLEEKIEHYTSHDDEALAIILAAQEYVAPFRDQYQEHLIELLVMQRYLELSGQF